MLAGLSDAPEGECFVSMAVWCIAKSAVIQASLHTEAP
jgi:hypothetical protein